MRTARDRREEAAMFDGGEMQIDGDVMIEEADWKILHRRLRSIAKRRVALEAEEAGYLLEAEETRLYRRLGYTSMLEYMERELHYGPHAANERLRVARALTQLPLIAELFGDGELCFSTVRELTRVATPATEEAFLRNAQGKTAHQVQQMVAGLKLGDPPDAPPDPRRIKQRVTMDLSVESCAAWRQLRAALDDERGERLSDDDFVQMLRRRVTETCEATDVPRPAVQTAVTTCKTCKQSFIETAGAALAIDQATAARLTCDAEHIGDLESDELTRVKPTVPAAIRRKVFHRDHFACVVPGCRSTRFLDLHHLRHREDGGDHSMSNCCLLCFGCHQRHHEGRLLITGRAPDLEFSWKHDEDVESAMSGPSWDWATVDANGTEEPGPEPDGPAVAATMMPSSARPHDGAT
jgi:5-methylcytosine-specific restriction endonuclease McrA